jgi:hypothetical protein
MGEGMTRRIFEAMRTRGQDDEEPPGDEPEKKEDPPFAPDANMTIKDGGEEDDAEQTFANAFAVLLDASAEKLNAAARKAKLKEIGEDEFAQIDKDELQRGAEVEREHTDDMVMAAVIAARHILEFPDYYDALRDMEDTLKEKHGKGGPPDPGASPSHSLDPHGDGEDDGW